MSRDTLLVIDDSPLDLAILNEIFKHLFHVECFEEARPALAYIHRNAHRICGVLLDICLGKRGAGFLVLQQLQTAPETMDLPVILITTDAREEYVLRAVEKGAVDFLVKPVDPQTVQERVCAVVHSAWPAGSTILDSPASNAQISTASHPAIPDQADHWERLLSLFFLGRKALSLPYYRQLARLTALLATSYARAYPGCGFTEADGEMIGRAAAFCDIGLLGIPDDVIEKGPEQQGAERDLYYRHTALGHALFTTGGAGGHPLAGWAAEIAYWHHKNYDGSGIPASEPAEKMPLSAQLTHAAMRILEYARYFQDYSDGADRALRTMANDVGRTISPQIYATIQTIQDSLAKEITPLS